MDDELNTVLRNKRLFKICEAVSAHHKELWRKQAKAMQEYVDVLGERIKDLIDNGWTVEVIKHIFSFLPDAWKA